MQSIGKAAEAVSDPLTDPRLAVKVTLRKQDVEMATALESLSRLGHVRLTNALPHPERLSFACHGMPLRAVLDGIAGAYNGEWQRGPNASLVLNYAYDSHELDPDRPHTQAEADEDAAGRPLPGELGQLPPDTLKALETDQSMDGPNAPPPGLAFGDLPPAMQATLSQMQRADLRAMSEGQLASFPESLKTFQDNDITQDRVTLRTDDDSQDTRYNIRFIMPPRTDNGVKLSSTGSYEVSVVVFEDPRDQGHGIAAAEPPPPSDAAQVQADADSRAAALATDPALKQKVSLTTGLAPLTDALAALSAKTGLAFAAQEQDGVHSVAYKNMPLSDVLDGLAARYTTDAVRCTWGERPGGVVVFHYGLTAKGQEAILPQLKAAAEQAEAEQVAQMHSGGGGQ